MADKQIYILRELDKFASVTEALRAKGYRQENIVLEKKIIEANYLISKRLEVPLATKLFYLSRLRVVEGKPCSVEKTYIDYERVKGLEKVDFNNESFYELLELKTGIRIIKSKEEILLVEANEQERALLELAPGAEILLIRGTSYKDQGKPVEYFELSSETSFYRFRSVSAV